MPQKDFVFRVGDTLFFDMEAATHCDARHLPKALGENKRRVPVKTLIEVTSDQGVDPCSGGMYGVEGAAYHLGISVRQVQRTGLTSESWTRWVGNLPCWNVNSIDCWWTNSYQPQCSENKRR